MHMFWRQGYKATSIEDLAGAMAINRFSLYDTFGDKQALYLKALEKYRRDCTTDLLSALDGGDGLAAIESYFERLAEVLSSDLGRRGCLMQNATVECAGGNAAVAASAHAFNDHVQDLLHQALERARADGTLNLGGELRDRARGLFALAQGMMVMAKDAPASGSGDALAGTARFVADEIKSWRNQIHAT